MVCHAGPVKTQKLTSVDAFVVRDFPDAPSVGVVRAANKILPAGAGEMARSMTYRFALLGMERGGASAGINAPVGDRLQAVAAFAREVLPEIADGSLMLDPSGAVDPAAFSAVTDADQRNPIARETVNHAVFADRLLALGALTAASRAAGGLEDKMTVIEGFDRHGPTLAAGIAGNGGRITGVSTPKGAITSTDGFLPADLNQAWTDHGLDMVEHLGDVQPANRIFGTPGDVLFVGSKMGVLNHKGAEFVSAKVVVPTSEVPYTTKAVLALERAGTTVLPDFLTTAGQTFADWADPALTTAEIEETMMSRLGELTETVLQDPVDMPVIAAAKAAEAFMGTWQENLPFGRPFAP